MNAYDLALGLLLIVLLIAWWRRAARGLLTLGATGLLLGSLAVWLLLERWQAVATGMVGLLMLLTLALQHWRGKPRTGRPWFSGTLLGLTSIAALAALYLFPVLPLPAPDGPHAVGTRSFELVDHNRLGVMAAPDDAPRRLLVRVWYPAKPQADAQPEPYFTAAEAHSTARGMGSLLGFAPLLAHARQITSNSLLDAPLADIARPLPVVFFNHGYTGFAWQNSVLMEALASHGYVVYAVQHSYDASPTLFADGTVAPLDPALVAAMGEQSVSAEMIEGFTSSDFDERLDGQLANVQQNLDKRSRIAVISAPTWVADQRFVHDSLQAGQVPAAVAELAAASDFSRVGQLGMSYGGSTAGAVCMLDKRCAAMANLDGGDFHFTPFAENLPVPLLMLHSDLSRFYSYWQITPQNGPRSFNDFSYERFEQAGLRPDIYRLQLKDSAHNGLTDLPLLIRQPLAQSLIGSTPSDILLQVLNDFVLGFFDKHLRGQDNGFPDVHYARHQGWALPYDNSAVRTWWLGKPEAERRAIEQRIAALKDEASQLRQ